MTMRRSTSVDTARTSRSQKGRDEARSFPMQQMLILGKAALELAVLFKVAILGHAC